MRPVYGIAHKARLAGKAMFERVRTHPKGRAAGKALQFLLLALIVGILFWRISNIGWRDVIAHLPQSPWFYAFWLLRYLTLPTTEMFVYRIILDRPMARHFPAFVRKRVYNYGVAGYSGEAFLALWARRTFGLSAKDALIAVKDGNILAALTANIATAVLIAGLYVTGALAPAAAALPAGSALFALAFATAAGVSLIVIALRRKLAPLSPGKTAPIIALHGARQLVQIGLYVAMYAAAIPSAPAGVWLLFIALQLAVSRIPFLPTQDLAYVTAALSLSGLVGAPGEEVAGMLIAEAGLSQALNFTLFFATMHLARGARNEA
jgi:hypothetical protein